MKNEKMERGFCGEAVNFLREVSRNDQFKQTVKKGTSVVLASVTVACLILQAVEPMGWMTFARFWVGNLLEGAVLTYAAVAVFFAVMQGKLKRA